MKFKTLSLEKLDELTNKETSELESLIIENSKKIESLKLGKENDKELNDLESAAKKIREEWKESMQGPKEIVFFCLKEIRNRDKISEEVQKSQEV